MSVSAAPFLPQRYCDGNNVPLVGGKLFSYAAGTTTKIPTYTASSGLTPNTNPVILNARGEAPVFLDNSLNYKLVLAPATDTDPPTNPIWTEDNISPSLVGGIVTPKQFGAVGDGVTDDSAAFVAAIAHLKSIAVNTSSNGYYKASPELFVPAGKYYMGTTTLDITHTFQLRGDPTAKSDIVSASWLQWADGCTGVRVQRYNTSGASTTDGTTHFGGDGFTIKNLRLSGGYAGTESESHGIHGRARFIAEDVNIDNFSGNGVHSDADDGGGSGIAGNSNGSRLIGVTVSGCRDGLCKTGGNSNAWTVIDFETSGNRRWGTNDTSFLGSTYIGGQDANNGLIPGTAPGIVSNGGNRYAIVSGQETAGSTTAPSGTADTTIWYYVGAGGVNTPLNIPAWSSGMSLRAGGAAIFNNTNSQTKVDGLYVEGGQGPIQGNFPALVVGGQMPSSYAIKGKVAWLRNYQGQVVSQQIGATDAVTGLGTFLQNDRISFQNAAGGNDLEALWFNNDLCFSTSNNTGNPSLFAVRWLGQNTSIAVGAYRFDFDNGFGVAHQKWFPGTAAPTTGTYVVGDRINTTAPTLTGALNWFCSAGGTPGTWFADYPYLRADPTTGIGYVAGARGTVTQATSKSTSVTINNVSMQITTSNAALASNTVVTFLVTNSAVATNDTPIVVLQSGNATAGTYEVWSEGIAAGSFKVNVRNISAGSLSEALVLNITLIKG